MGHIQINFFCNQLFLTFMKTNLYDSLFIGHSQGHCFSFVQVYLRMVIKTIGFCHVHACFHPYLNYKMVWFNVYICCSVLLLVTFEKFSWFGKEFPLPFRDFFKRFA